MRNSTRASLVAALFSAGFLLSAPAQGATPVAMPSHAQANDVIQKVDYRPYGHFNRRHFHRNFYRYPYRHGYRHFYRRHYANDYYLYHRPAVRFGLEVRKHRHYRHYGY